MKQHPDDSNHQRITSTFLQKNWKSTLLVLLVVIAGAGLYYITTLPDTPKEAVVSIKPVESATAADYAETHISAEQAQMNFNTSSTESNRQEMLLFDKMDELDDLKQGENNVIRWKSSYEKETDIIAQTKTTQTAITNRNNALTTWKNALGATPTTGGVGIKPIPLPDDYSRTLTYIYDPNKEKPVGWDPKFLWDRGNDKIIDLNYRSLTEEEQAEYDRLKATENPEHYGDKWEAGLIITAIGNIQTKNTPAFLESIEADIVAGKSREEIDAKIREFSDIFAD